MSTRRWCKRCDCETLHDVFRDTGSPVRGQRASGFGRILLGVATLGMTELMVGEKFAICQRCGSKKKLQ